MKKTDLLEHYSELTLTEIAEIGGVSQGAVSLWTTYVSETAAKLYSQHSDGVLIFDEKLYEQLRQEAKEKRSAAAKARWARSRDGGEAA